MVLVEDEPNVEPADAMVVVVMMVAGAAVAVGAVCRAVERTVEYVSDDDFARRSWSLIRFGHRHRRLVDGHLADDDRDA